MPKKTTIKTSRASEMFSSEKSLGTEQLISKGRLVRLRTLAEHKLTIANTSVKGPVRLACIEAKELLQLVEATEALKQHLQRAAAERRTLRKRAATP